MKKTYSQFLPGLVTSKNAPGWISAWQKWNKSALVHGPSGPRIFLRVSLVGPCCATCGIRICNIKKKHVDEKKKPTRNKQPLANKWRFPSKWLEYIGIYMCVTSKYMWIFTFLQSCSHILSRNCCFFVNISLSNRWTRLGAPSVCRRHSTPAVLRVVPAPRCVLMASTNEGTPKWMVSDFWWKILSWLVVWTPLKNISQLGWLATQYMGK